MTGRNELRIFTIGYEGSTVGEFLAALRKAGIERVIDVRALPLSRRPGFSKTPLRNALAEAGVEYVHLKALARRQPAVRRRGQGVIRIWSVSMPGSSKFPRRSPSPPRCSSSRAKSRALSCAWSGSRRIVIAAFCSTLSRRTRKWCTSSPEVARD